MNEYIEEFKYYLRIHLNTNEVTYDRLVKEFLSILNENPKETQQQSPRYWAKKIIENEVKRINKFNKVFNDHLKEKGFIIGN